MDQQWRGARMAALLFIAEMILKQASESNSVIAV
jgi:hypothetical protein